MMHAFHDHRPAIVVRVPIVSLFAQTSEPPNACHDVPRVGGGWKRTSRGATPIKHWRYACDAGYAAGCNVMRYRETPDIKRGGRKPVAGRITAA
jgi:hypothetical protein